MRRKRKDSHTNSDRNVFQVVVKIMKLIEGLSDSEVAIVFGSVFIQFGNLDEAQACLAQAKSKNTSAAEDTLRKKAIKRAAKHLEPLTESKRLNVVTTIMLLCGMDVWDLLEERQPEEFEGEGRAIPFEDDAPEPLDVIPEVSLEDWRKRA